MGKQTEEKTNESVIKSAPKIVKLNFQFAKKNEIKIGKNFHKKETLIAEKRIEVFENFKVGDSVFQLSKPKHQLLNEAKPENIAKNDEFEKMENRTSEFNKNNLYVTKNEVTQEQLMHLDKDELKYLKTIVLNKHKDIDMRE